MRERLTFANVISCVALFLALGGSALALKANSIGSRQVKDDSLQGRDIRDASLKGQDIAADSIGPREIEEPTNDLQSIRMDSDIRPCDPTTSQFVSCASVTLPLSEPSQVLLTAGGGQTGTAGASGACRFEANGQPVLDAGPPTVGDATARSLGQENGFALTAVAGTPTRIPAGSRVFRIVCNEQAADVSYLTTLSAVALGDGLE